MAGTKRASRPCRWIVAGFLLLSKVVLLDRSVTVKPVVRGLPCLRAPPTLRASIFIAVTGYSGSAVWQRLLDGELDLLCAVVAARDHEKFLAVQ